MAKQMQTLAKETAIYGVSSILGKFLNWMLTPFYTFYLVGGPAALGEVTNLYAWTALILVILTCGLETGFFRFANKNKAQDVSIYGNVTALVGFNALFFVVICFIFLQPFANFLKYQEHPEYIMLMAITVAIDAFASIPFAWLRYTKRPMKFMTLKLLYVVLNIILNIFFFLVCPWLMKHAPDTISWFYNPDYGVGYVVIANAIATVLQTIILLFYTYAGRFKFDFALLKPILKYSFPLLILGIAGIMNQTLDKILYPFISLGEAGKAELGIYGAVSKMAMVMLMFTQAFRYAYEPFIFAQHKGEDNLATYADAMKYFIIASLLIFLGMVLYIDVFKLLIHKDYWSGLKVLPIILWSFIFQGVFFNLSLWYKLTDKTRYGAWFSLLGTTIIIVGNILLVPKFGYMGAAWSAFACYITIMFVSYFFGQKQMPIKYDLKSIASYVVLALVLYGTSFMVDKYVSHQVIKYSCKTILFLIFLTYFIKQDLPLSQIPYINKFFKKK